MATGAAGSSDPRASTDGAARDAAQRERYIHRRIHRTSRYVQLRDLVTSFIQGAAVTIAFLLALTVWDHWVAPLALWSRAAALLVILAFWVCVAVTQFAPLVIRRINPVYAARTIEEGVPGLKNSLTNYLLLRSQRAGVRSVVYEAVGQQAANDLTRVSIETAVDRSRLVRIGYVFAALVVFGGLYSLLSPKDPWQTVRRVATPWADIARPSRVNIEEVRVDDIVCDGREQLSVYLGQSARVSAVVRGLDPDQPVVLHYSTADEQTINRPIAMHATASGSRFEAEVPEDETGLQQDIVFRIEADDAITRDYTLKVLAAPHIVIDSIAYDYPAYTRLEPRVVRDRGDIRGVEGTRVTITASANQEIESAYIHFGEIDATDGTVVAVASSNYVRMRSDGKLATASFQLSLPVGRREARRRSYEVRFTNGSGQKNDRPVQHLLEVIPDLAPEIEILTPAQQEIELPADREQIIELLARDPDFGLASVQLHMVSGGEPILTKTLLDDPGGWTGNANRRFRFVPREYGLQPGHLVTYWGTAQDNVTADATGSSEPNTTSTSKYRFLIVAAERPDGTSESTPNPDPPGTENGSTGEASEGDPAQPSQNGSRDPDRPVDQNEEAAGESAEEQRGQEPSDSPPGNDGSQTPGGEDGEPGEEGDGSGSGDGSARGNQPDSSSDDGPNEGGADRRATDGRDDGEIFEDVLERMRQSGDASESATPTDERAAHAEPDADGQDETTRPDDGVGADDAQSADDWNQTQHDVDGQSESSGSKTGPDRKQGDGDDADATPGEGGQTDGIAQPEAQPATDAEQGDAEEQPQAGLGDNGAGEKSPDEQGAPASQEANRQQPKQVRPGQVDADDSPQEAKSPSSSKRQSDSEGGESGDRSGGGKGGGGQDAQQPGNDSAGSSSAADDGAGAAHESGDGETSSRVGDDVEASGKTGSAGNRRGSGATSGEPSSPSDPPDGATSPDQKDGPSESGHQPTDGSGSQGQQSTGQLPTTGGRPGHAEQQAAQTPPGREPGEDDPNLKFANEATDMALRYLKDQQDDPDRALLDDLGWSDDELRRFIERWDQLKQGSRRDAAARKELHERLESLGLQPPQRRTRSGSTPRDPRGGLTDSAHRSSPPPEYLDQVRAYQQSIAEERE